jgi:lysine/ornithine N-monooxygenase
MVGSQIKKCQICIIGAGPAGLSSLSAIHEPYSLDTMNDAQVRRANHFIGGNRFNGEGPSKKTICVIDPHANWMDGWKQNFEKLGISHLRSPAMAHPDHFDQNALLAYAISNGREDELIESGCFEQKSLLSLGQTQIGLWKLPSTSLFHDFCQNLAKQLPHDYVQGAVSDVSREDEDGAFTLTLADGTELIADSIVLALGTIGNTITPSSLQNVPSRQMISWTDMKENLQPNHKKVLVVGGGLTAVQAAQYALREGKEVVLCSRRSLIERHFDINIDWFDRRYANKLISDFYHQDESHRLSVLREARGGGSVPPIYMKDLRKWRNSGMLTNITAEAKFTQITENGKIHVSFEESEDRNSSSPSSFDCIILACGIQPDCNSNPLVQNIQKNFPIEVVGGFPSVSEDLEWAKNLFVVGGLASLNTGPDSANLMGIRRSASIVANALQCRCWLRKDSKVLTNSYELFWDSDSDSDSDDEN